MAAFDLHFNISGAEVLSVDHDQINVSNQVLNMGRKPCAAQNCFNNEKSKTMHVFPCVYVKQNDSSSGLDPMKVKRCRTWAQNSGNKTLLSVYPGNLSKNVFICTDHFSDKQRSSKSIKHLKRTAVPDLIHQSIPESDMAAFDLHFNIPGAEVLSVDNDQINVSNQVLNISRKPCAAQNCFNDENSKTMHVFPCVYVKQNDSSSGFDPVKVKRCREWVQKSGNKTLLSVHPTKLSKRFYLCTDHFSDEHRSSKSLKHLKITAVPIMSQIPIEECDVAVFEQFLNLTETVNSSLISIDVEVPYQVFSPANITENTNSVQVLGVIADNVTENTNIPQVQISNQECSCAADTVENNDPFYVKVPYHNFFPAEDSLETPDPSQVEDYDQEYSFVDNRAENPPKKKRKRCCFMGCTNNISRRYTFPSVIAKETGNLDHSALLRLYRWLEIIGNVELLRFSPISLRKLVICADHFSDDQFKNKLSGTLKPSAQPNSSNLVNDEDISLYKTHFSYVPGCPLKELEECWKDTDRALDFEHEMRQLCWFTCKNCNEKQLKFKYSTNVNSCFHYNKCADYSEVNNMDPGPVPPELHGLTFIEEQLVAHVHPMLSIFKLKPGLQFGYSGNIISFPQDIQPLATELPHKLQDVKSIISIEYENKDSKSHHFRVRSHKVYQALLWLTQNNPFYKDVLISSENMNALPEDEIIENDFSVTLKTPDEFEKDKECELCSNQQYSNVEGSCKNDDPTHTGQSENDFEIHRSTSSSNAKSDEENFPEKEETYVHESSVPTCTVPHPDEQIEATLQWPKLDQVPVNEFKTPGYIVCAFPTLFPRGSADLRDSHIKEIHPSEYFKHLLSYHDSRFSQHSTFRFFAMNSVMRWRALTDGNIFLKNHCNALLR